MIATPSGSQTAAETLIRVTSLRVVAKESVLGMVSVPGRAPESEMNRSPTRCEMRGAAT